jgi:hypothetical protein
MRFEQTHVPGHVGSLIAALLVDVALDVYTDQQLQGKRVDFRQKTKKNPGETLTDLLCPQAGLV